MSDFYQIPIDIKSNDPEYLRWEKLNFVLRRIFETLNNVDGRLGPIQNINSMEMNGNQISGGPVQQRAHETDYVTKSYFRSAEFGKMVVELLQSTGKTPLPVTAASTTIGGGSGGGGGGGGTSDHALLTHLSYATAGHTGFTPSTRLINTSAPLTGGGDLSSDRTIVIPQATGAADGFLDSADWTTFNAKVGGSGTSGTIPKFTAAATIGDSVITESSSKIGIGGAPSYTLEVAGQIKATNGSILPTVKSISISAGTLATDASQGNHYRCTVTADFTLSNPTNAVDGQRLIWEFKQDGTGGWSITLDTKFVVPSNVAAVTLTATANGYDMLGAIYNSSLDKFIVTGFMKEYS